jgi:toxin-antitoxin system PIN domain toxin
VIALLDVNVLVALAWPNHVHHDVALDWFKRSQSAGWATCPLTESGFVRVSSNQRAIPEAKSPQEAILLLRQVVALPHHHFLSDDISMARSQHVEERRLVGHRQVTEAHLLALALRHAARLVTLDRGVTGLVPRGVDPSSAPPASQGLRSPSLQAFTPDSSGVRRRER